MSDELQKVVHELVENLEKMGVFVIPGQVAINFNAEDSDVVDNLRTETISLKEALRAELASVNIQMIAVPGPSSITDQYLYPEKFAEEQEFLKIAPLESDIAIQGMLDEYIAMMSEPEEDEDDDDE
jgi:hypothetical protein